MAMILPPAKGETLADRGWGGRPPDTLTRRQKASRRRHDLLRQRLVACERAQLARQVHDDLAAVLTAIKSCVCVAAARSASGCAPTGALLADAALLVDAALATARRIGVNLRPTLLEEMGLWGAIDWQSKSLGRRTGIRTTFYTDAVLESRRFAEACELVIYRVLSEAITNVEKHAHATSLDLRIVERDGLVVASAKDDGVGALAADLTGRGSLGMVGMREQVAEIGGVLQVDAGEGKGVGIYLAIPIDHCHEY